MSKVKNALSSMAFAATLLMVSGAAPFSIVLLVKSVTGWTMPTWVAVIVAGTVSATLIIAALSLYGVTIPYYLAQSLKLLQNYTA